MEVTESKLDCGVYFQSKGELSEKMAGLFHCFEHVYDSETTFWYGVVEVDANWDDFVSYLTKEKLSTFEILLELCDGRVGIGRHLNSAFHGGIVQISLFGATRLCDPDLPMSFSDA